MIAAGSSFVILALSCCCLVTLVGASGNGTTYSPTTCYTAPFTATSDQYCSSMTVSVCGASANALVANLQSFSTIQYTTLGAAVCGSLGGTASSAWTDGTLCPTTYSNCGSNSACSGTSAPSSTVAASAVYCCAPLNAWAGMFCHNIPTNNKLSATSSSSLWSLYNQIPGNWNGPLATVGAPGSCQDISGCINANSASSLFSSSSSFLFAMLLSTLLAVMMLALQ